MTEKHLPLPKDTKAFICANCGAVSLDANKICKVMGRGQKHDWCGVKGTKPPAYCKNNKNTERWQCQNCGQISVNPALLCEPVKMDVPK